MKFQWAVHDFKKPQGPETVKTEEFLDYVMKQFRYIETRKTKIELFHLWS